MTLSVLQRSSLTLGMTLGYNGTVSMQQGQMVVSYSSALVKYRSEGNSFVQDYHIPIGKEDQVITASATHPSEPLAAVCLSGSSCGCELQLVSTTTGQVQVCQQLSQEASSVAWSADGVVLVVCLRQPGFILVLTYEQGQLMFQRQISGFLPAECPFVPRYVTADPNQRGFCVEIGLRCFYLQVILEQNLTRTPGDSRFVSAVKLLFIEQLQGAQAVTFAAYKKLQYIVGGFADSRVSFCLVEPSNDPGKVVSFPYETAFDESPKRAAVFGQMEEVLSFESVLCLRDPPVVVSQTNQVFIPSVVPREAPAPRFGVSCLHSHGQEVAVGLRGGMVVRLSFASRLKAVQKRVEFEDSEELLEEIRPEDAEDLPRVDCVQTLNLNVEALLHQQIGANSLQTARDLVAAAQEETSSWADARAQLEVLQLVCVGGGGGGGAGGVGSAAGGTGGTGSASSTGGTESSYAFLLYDPVTLQVAACLCDAAWALEYSILHGLRPVAQGFVSVFNLFYAQQAPALAGILQQVAEQRRQLLAHSGPAAGGSTAAKGLSLLQVAAGAAGSQAGQLKNQLLTGHIPAGLDTAQKRALLLRSYASNVRGNRLAIGTREGLILLYDLEGGRLLSSAKLIDAVLSVDLASDGLELAVGCTDTVRFLVQNGRFLNQLTEAPVKMAQLLMYQPHAILACANAKVAEIDRMTHKILKSIDGHNAAVTSATVCPGKYDPAQYYVTSDAKGMLLLWESCREKSLIQFNAREPISSVRHLVTQNGQLPTVVAAVGGRVVGVDFQKQAIQFKASLLSEGRHIPIRDLAPLDEARFILCDFAGCLWSVIMPNELSGSFTVSGKSFGRVSGMQQQQPGYTERLELREAADAGSVTAEGALQLRLTESWVFCGGVQPGGLCCALRLERPENDRKSADGQTVGMSLGHFQRLVAAKGLLEEKRVQTQLEYEHQTRTAQQNNRAQLELQKTLSEKEVKAQQEQCKSFSAWAEKEAEVQEQKLQELDRQNSEQLQKIEADFRQKSALIAEQQQILERQMQEMLEAHVQTLQELRQEFQTALAKMHQEKDRGLSVQQKLLEERERLLEREAVQFREMLETAEEDADVQLMEQQAREQRELERKKAGVQGLAAEAGMIRNKFEAMSKQTLAFMSNLSSCENAILQQKSALSQLQAQREDTEREKAVRRERIAASEERIYELKQRAKELEKHRFVLDFRIKDLQRLIQPREQEIHDVQDQVREVGESLEGFHREIGEISDQIARGRAEQLRLKADLEGQKGFQAQTQLFYRQLECDVAGIVQAHGRYSYDELKKACEALGKYGGKTAVDAEQRQADEEKRRHKAFLAQAARQLSQQLACGKEDVVQENQRIVEENTELLKEAAVLRREIQKIVHAPVSQNNTESQKVFQMRITAQEAEIKRLQKRLSDLQEMQDE